LPEPAGPDPFRRGQTRRSRSPPAEVWTTTQSAPNAHLRPWRERASRRAVEPFPPHGGPCPEPACSEPDGDPAPCCRGPQNPCRRTLAGRSGADLGGYLALLVRCRAPAPNRRLGAFGNLRPGPLHLGSASGVRSRGRTTPAFDAALTENPRASPALPGAAFDPLLETLSAEGPPAPLLEPEPPLPEFPFPGLPPPLPFPPAFPFPPPPALAKADDGVSWRSAGELQSKCN